MGIKLQITESEKNKILDLYNVTPIMENIVISDWLSPDEKYCIFLDELYDINSKVKIGNIWENFDHFKFFLKHSFEVATNVPEQIKESVLESINTFVLTESTQNMVLLKQYLKDILNENVVTDFGNWVVDTGKSAVQGVSNFVKTGYEGLKKMGIAISQGDWMKVVDLLKKGSLYVARRIRAALYHPIGIVLDAILVASGIGIAVKMLPWAIVVGLDIYEFMTGNYEHDMTMGWRLLFFGTDILGLVLAGAVAKTAQTTVSNLIRKFGNSEKGLQNAVKSSPQLKNILQNISKNLPKVSGLINQARASIPKTSMFFKFFSSIISGVGRFIKWIASLIGKILGVGGTIATKLGGGTKTVAAANAAVPAAALGTYFQGEIRKAEEDFNKQFISYMKNNKPEFGGV
jgi:hypothetical protein